MGKAACKNWFEQPFNSALPHNEQVKRLKQYAMPKEFYYKGHHYKVVPIEGSSDHFIIKDGRKTRRVEGYIAEIPMQYVERLFKE